MRPVTDIGALRARYELAMACTDAARRAELPVERCLAFEREAAQNMISGVDAYRAERVEIVMLEEGLEGSVAHLRLGVNFEAQRRLSLMTPPTPPNQPSQ